MNAKRIGTVMAAMVLLAAAAAFAARVGQLAPDFVATDSNGQSHRLADYRGKYVVLEWHNNGCPYTQKHYQSGNMESLQREWTARGVIWFTVISSAPGAQGYALMAGVVVDTAAQENDYMREMHAAPTAALLDPDGQLGHLYDAKTTPHMFVINPEGMLIYDGAIDDRPTPDPSDIAGATNYVSQALSEAMAGRPVSVAATRPYGCSVKYAQ